jgi:hypothetical protein
MEVSKWKKTVTMRYKSEAEQENKELEIRMEHTVRAILDRLKTKEHMVVDSKGRIFLEQGHLFTYFSSENPLPVGIVRELKVIVKPPRKIEPVKDSRESIVIKFGDMALEGAKSSGANYRLIFDQTQTELNVPGWWTIDHVRADESKIFVDAMRKPDDHPPADDDWVKRRSWPQLGSVGDATRRAIRTQGPPAYRAKIEAPVEFIRNQLSTSRIGTKAVRITLEGEGKEPRESVVPEDVNFAELARAAYAAREWPTDCILSLMNVPAILEDRMKVKIGEKAANMEVEIIFRYRTSDNRVLSVNARIGKFDVLNRS